MIKAIVHDLRLCWVQLALTDIFYKLIAFALLTPIVAVLFQVFMTLSGRTVLADEDILFFFVKPLGWVCLIIVGANPVVSKWSFLQVANPSARLKEMT